MSDYFFFLLYSVFGRSEHLLSNYSFQHFIVKCLLINT